MIALCGTEATIADQITSQPIFATKLLRRPRPQPAQAVGWCDDATAIAEQIDGVENVVVEQNSEGTIKAGDITLEDVSIVGTSSGFPSVRDMGLESGRYFTEKDIDRKQKVAVLGASLAEELFGDEPAVGQMISVANTKLTVIGVFADWLGISI
jgi:hypothetical protein